MAKDTNLVAKAGQFVNKRTGKPVPAGTKYHMHPEKGPMEGAVHDPKVKGGTKGHDFFAKPAKAKAGGAVKDLNKVSKELNKASKMHAGQSKRVKTIFDKLTKKKQDGGLLVGPSHKDGGILTQVGDQPTEMEGGEFVMNKRATAKLEKSNQGLLAKMNKTGKLEDGGLVSKANKSKKPNESMFTTYKKILKAITRD